MKIAIIGAGGFGREVRTQFLDDAYSRKGEAVPLVEMFVDDEYVEASKGWASPLSELIADIDSWRVLVAIGDPKARQTMVEKLPSSTKYHTFIHSSAKLLDNDMRSIKIGRGSIVCAGAILTTNIRIGKHAHLNLGTTVGHDCVIGDFFTTAPGVRISGNAKIGNRVYFGTNACTKEKISICDDATIGLNAGVVKDITRSGTYVGTPAALLPVKHVGGIDFGLSGWKPPSNSAVRQKLLDLGLSPGSDYLLDEPTDSNP